MYNTFKQQSVNIDSKYKFQIIYIYRNSKHLKKYLTLIGGGWRGGGQTNAHQLLSFETKKEKKTPFIIFKIIFFNMWKLFLNVKIIGQTIILQIRYMIIKAAQKLRISNTCDSTVFNFQRVNN